MIRKIININENLCNGCEACVTACHEGAIQMVDGKARLIRDDYCDGLGDCLPVCPTNAITFIEREALEYNEEAVKAKNKGQSCPGLRSIKLNTSSELNNWPIQIKLVPTSSSIFEDADLLIAADCTAYAYKDFHNEFMNNHKTIIACPKLDNIDYSIKLTAIFKENNIKSIALVKMEVPCCNGIENAVKRAIIASGKNIPFTSTTISRNGKILN